MTGSVALDVVIGLVFIYLLYSLFASMIAEIISNILTLRAKNLREALNRMINDEDADGDVKYPRLAALMDVAPKEYVNNLINNFYNHQEVKYLGRKSQLSPSAIKASNFSKVLLDKIKKLGSGKTEVEQIRSGLNKLIKTTDIKPKDLEHVILGSSTAEYVESLLDDCQNDLEKFRGQLENWFDRTMEQTTEWYKQRMQKILLIIGFFIAWFFNVDTFSIVKKLSVDQDARDKMVQMASAYIENNSHQKYGDILPTGVKVGTDTLKLDSATKAALVDYNTRLEELQKVNDELRKDMEAANSTLGLGSWLPDSLKINKKGKIIYPEYVNAAIASNLIGPYDRSAKGIEVRTCWKWQYLFSLLLGWPRILGYFITALAISLGAPFWFDMLNKLMKLRGTVKEPTGTVAAASPQNQKPKTVG
ncbi:MAG: hypothetical protein ABJF11_02195 [Reichenbachiella sp.]|uniref:hypothetical protein n=1 Tax=Reichenbachiella sp. TaxID=2184521 RepID=UPI0032631A7A